MISKDLPHLFQRVADVLRDQQTTLNQADSHNGNHGDHMVEIFQDAVLAAQESPTNDLAEAMAYASRLLRQRSENGSAQVYADGLEQFARQFRENQVSLEDLVSYVQDILGNERLGTGDMQSGAGGQDQEKKYHSGGVLKALLGGLSGWQKAEAGENDQDSRLGMGYLFEVGIAYMQAKQRGGTKAEVVADAAVSVCPLNRVSHRSQSGKIAIQALLEAMRA